MRAGSLLLLLLTFACHPQTPPRGPTSASEPAAVKAPCKCEIAQVLDGFHAAAARADEPGYFAAFAPEGVFLGTDASERWDVPAFRAYVHPHFAAGRGFVYVPRDRHVSFSRDARTAWFDERLDHARYGELRGTGVLVKRADGWKIAHYNLTFTVPNALAPQVVELMRGPSPSP